MQVRDMSKQIEETLLFGRMLFRFTEVVEEHSSSHAKQPVVVVDLEKELPPPTTSPKTPKLAASSASSTTTTPLVSQSPKDSPEGPVLFLDSTLNSHLILSLLSLQVEAPTHTLSLPTGSATAKTPPFDEREFQELHHDPPQRSQPELPATTPRQPGVELLKRRRAASTFPANSDMVRFDEMSLNSQDSNSSFTVNSDGSDYDSDSQPARKKQKAEGGKLA